MSVPTSSLHFDLKLYLVYWDFVANISRFSTPFNPPRQTKRNDENFHYSLLLLSVRHTKNVSNSLSNAANKTFFSKSFFPKKTYNKLLDCIFLCVCMNNRKLKKSEMKNKSFES